MSIERPAVGYSTPMHPSTIKYAAVHALLAVLYIALVACFLWNANNLFGKADTPFSTMAFLLTFVISAAVMGMLVFGRPLLWYLDGRKKEAVELALATVGCLIIIAALVFTLLAL